MLRQLARLTRRVTDRHGAVAIAVYAGRADELIAAAERGDEGVACIDDAARALTLLCELWSATRQPILRAWAVGLLEFVLTMQDADGRFINFIVDWSGKRNERGPTSVAGGGFWHARGVRGLASAAVALDDPRAWRGVRRGLAHLRSEPVPANVRAIHVLAGLELLAAGEPDLVEDVARWADELVACRRDGVLFDDPDQSEPHLWAHVQEGALAAAGERLRRPDLVAVARESALRYLAPLIEARFDLPTVQPDGVACAVFGVERLAAVTGERRFARLTEAARAWFHESNPAGLAVYDRAVGRVHDGIDRGVLNMHSGAESNIAAAQALFPEVARSIGLRLPAIERYLPACLTSPGALPRPR